VLLLREDPAVARVSPRRSAPREGRGLLLFVVASVIGHGALVAAAPAMPSLAIFPEEDLVYMDLAPEPPEVAAAPLPPELEEPEPIEEPEPVEVPEPIEEPEPDEPEPVEPEPVEEPTVEPVEEPTEEPIAEEPTESADASLAETAHDGAEAAETVASTEGGLTVDRAAGTGREGAARGATRTEPAPVRPDPNALRSWRLSAMRALGRPQPTLALRRTGQEGIAWVAFQVDGSGRVIGVRLFQSSGHELVDEAALAFARTRRALPRPPAPWEVRWVRLPIRYRAVRG
jgi:protein TonB